MYEYITEAKKSYVWEETDGCAKKYICTLAVYLMTIDSLTLKISIQIESGAPGHGKDVADGLSARDKVI